MRQGLQTRVTSAVKAYAAGFKGEGLDFVRNVLDGMARFRRKPFSASELSKIYARRSADQIIRDRFVAFPKVNEFEPGMHAAVGGCIDYNIVLCAVLRARGIPAKFTREGVHSRTHFFAGGKWYEADPTIALTRHIAELRMRRGKPVNGADLPHYISEISPERRAELDRKKAVGTFAEGLDAWDIGILSLKDFSKYMKRD